jgi:hypothetical protein
MYATFSLFTTIRYSTAAASALVCAKHPDISGDHANALMPAVLNTGFGMFSC